jgi:hypothetical protein
MVLAAHARQGLGLLWRIRLGEWSVLAVGRKPARKASGRAAKPARKQERRPVKGRRSG